MYSRKTGRKRPVLAALIAMAILVITLYYRGGETVISGSQDILFSVTATLQKGVAAAIRPFKRVRDYTLELGHMTGENRHLRSENRRLKGQVRRLQGFEAENRRLTRLAGFRSRSSYRTVAARIVSRSPTSWQSLMTLDIGRAGGIRKNMAVITDRGLAGKIVKVSTSASLAQLIDDRRSGVAVELSRTGSTGIVEGGVAKNLRLRFIAADADIKEGDRLITSGAGGVFPRGLNVGRVTAISRSVYSLEKLVDVKPAVDFKRLANVLIVTDKPPEELKL